MKQGILLIVLVLLCGVGAFLYIEAENGAQAKLDVALWHERMSEDVPLDELKGKYPEIFIYQLNEAPHTRWAIVRVPSKIGVVVSHHEVVLFKDEHGGLLTFWKGPHKRSYFGVLEHSRIEANRTSVSVYDVISDTMRGAGFSRCDELFTEAGECGQ